MSRAFLHPENRVDGDQHYTIGSTRESRASSHSGNHSPISSYGGSIPEEFVLEGEFNQGTDMEGSTLTLNGTKRTREPSIEVRDFHPSKKTVIEWLAPKEGSGSPSSRVAGTTIPERFQDYQGLAGPEYRDGIVKMIYGCVRDITVLMESDVRANDLAGKCIAMLQQMTGIDTPDQYGLKGRDWLDLGGLLYESQFAYVPLHPDGRNKVPDEELSEFHEKCPVKDLVLYGQYWLGRPETVPSEKPPEDSQYSYSTHTGAESSRVSVQDQ